MNRRAIIPLLVGLGIGLLAVKFAINTIRKAQASSESNKTVSVVRAKLDIAAHEEIQKDMVETVETADSLFAPANERMDKVDTAIGPESRTSEHPVPVDSSAFLSPPSPMLLLGATLWHKKNRTRPTGPRAIRRGKRVASFVATPFPWAV